MKRIEEEKENQALGSQTCWLQLRRTNQKG